MEAGVGSVRYVRRSESDWRRLIQEWAQSGQSQEAFCRTRGLALSSLCNWRRKLKGESVSSGLPPREAAGFIELTAPVETEKESPAWDVELSLGEGTVLRLRCACSRSVSVASGCIVSRRTCVARSMA